MTEAVALAVGHLRKRVRLARKHERGCHGRRRTHCKKDALRPEPGHVGREAKWRQRWWRWGRRPSESREVGEQVLVESTASAVECCALRVLRVLKAGDTRVHEGERIACVKKVVKWEHQPQVAGF